MTAKIGNTIDEKRELQEIYLPAQTAARPRDLAPPTPEGAERRLIQSETSRNIQGSLPSLDTRSLAA